MNKIFDVKDKKQTLIALLAVLSPIAMFRLIVSSWNARFVFSDVPEFFAAAKLVLNGQGAEVYRPEVIGDLQRQLFPQLGERIIPLFLPPIALPFLAPMGFIPNESIFVVWLAILAVALVASFFVLVKTFQVSKTNALWIFAGVWMTGPVLESLRIGQLSPLLLLVLVLALRALKANRALAAGLLFAVLLIKPQIIIAVLIFLVGVGRWKEISWLFWFATIMLTSSLLFFGVESYASYWELLNHQYRDAWMQPEVCATVRGQLLRIPGVVATIANTVSVVVMLVAWVGILALGRAYRNSEKWLEVGLIGVIPLGLFVSPHLYNYDLILLLPVVVLLTRLKLTKFESLGWLSLLVVSLVPLYILFYYGYMLPGGVLNPVFVPFLLAVIGGISVAVRNRPLKVQKAE